MTARVARGEIVQLRPDYRAEQLGDDALVAACATGDRAARALLFERFVDAVYRFVARMRGSDGSSVDDLVQQTFLSAYTAAGAFRGGHVRGWLLGIAANHVREYARKEIRRKTALRVLAEQPPADGPQNPARLADRARLVAQLPAAIEALPHDLRAALVLVDLEGERGADAAAVLGIPVGTLWRRVYEARQALRAALGGER